MVRFHAATHDLRRYGLHNRAQRAAAAASCHELLCETPFSLPACMFIDERCHAAAVCMQLPSIALSPRRRGDAPPSGLLEMLTVRVD